MRILERVSKVLGAVNGAVASLGAFCAMVFIAAMTAVILLQVFCRYVLNDPLSWPEEAARYMMVWMTFLVAPAAYRDNAFVRMESLVTRLTGRPRLFLEAVVHALIVATAVTLAIEAVWMVRKGAMMDSSALGIGMEWVFLILPVSLVVLFLVGLEKLLAIVQLVANEDVNDEDAHRYGGLAGIE